MRKQLWIFPLLIVILIFASMPLTGYAIGEVTPTPMPATPLPQPTVEPDFDADDLLADALQDIQAGQYLAAVNKADTVLAADPSNDEAYLVRSIAYARLGRLATAIDDMSQAIELAPYNYIYFQLRGDMYGQLGEDMNAVYDYDQAIFINALNEDAFRSRAQMNYQLGDNTAGDVDDFIARGLQRSSFGDNAGASDFFESAIDEGGNLPAVANAYYGIGSGYMTSGNNRDAISAFNDALAVNENLHIAYLARGIAYREEGDIQAAGEDFYQRISILGQEYLDESASVGDVLDLQMAYRRVYRIEFAGDAGMSINISADDTDGTFIDPLISLLDPAGNPIAGDDDFGGNLNSAIDNFTLPTTGTYTLLLGHAEGGYDFGFEGIVRVEISE